MVVDSYVETLGQMIQLLREYKPGNVTLENITKLCQTLGLESFVDDINNDLSRLSTASKIIVIDIDFDKKLQKVRDVKLVLASNFDYFNYFLDNFDSTKGESNNILLNSLTMCQDLKLFHENLQFLFLLDTYSQVDIDNATSSNATGVATSSGTNTSSIIHSSSNIGYNTIDNTMSASGSLSNVENGHSFSISNNKTGRLDLFKYFTELKSYIKKYFKENGIELDVITNINNSFGIYITKPKDKETNSTGTEIIAKIVLEKSKSPQHRLFEYVYSDATQNWINEIPDNNICGVSLIMEVYNKDVIFPESFITGGMIFETTKDPTRGKNRFINPQLSNGIALGDKSIPNEELIILNDFTTELIGIKKIDISNDNLDLLGEILKWIHWYSVVLNPFLNTLNEFMNSKIHSEDKKDIHSHPHGSNRRYSNMPIRGTISNTLQPASFRHRRSSSKNKKPNLSESTILKDEGLQQFNLHEIIAQPVAEDTNLSLDIDPNDEEAAIIDTDGNNDRMEVDDTVTPVISSIAGSNRKERQIVISEDQIKITEDLECSLYEERNKWEIFLKEMQEYFNSFM